MRLYRRANRDGNPRQLTSGAPGSPYGLVWAAVLYAIRIALAAGLVSVVLPAAASSQALHPSLGLAPPIGQPGGLATAVTDPVRFAGPGAAAAFADVRAAGATVVRLQLNWSQTAPDAPENGADPNDPAYDWSSFDSTLDAAISAGLTPIADIVAAPAWALAVPASSAGPGIPSADALGLFASAAAQRYDGGASGRPRIYLWQVWNEPNLDTNLSPQLVNGAPLAPAHYRAMVNAVAVSVKAVSPDNLVIAGGLAPFRDITPDTLGQNQDWGPLSFMRDLLCLSVNLKPTCHTPIRFDIWSTHPYTSGGPTHHAARPNDVSLGDLAKMSKVLAAAQAVQQISSSGPVRFWVTEFSWDSKPPDPQGVPTSLLERWVPEALYRMWVAGISLVTWFSVDDDPPSQSYFQSGLYYQNGKPKPYREGFRFPFVAFPRDKGAYVWGRTPWGRPGRVAVEQRVGSRWRPLGTVETNANGIFQRTFHAVSGTLLRARLVGVGERSLPFSLKAVPDQFFNPFGGLTLLEPPPRKHR